MLVQFVAVGVQISLSATASHFFAGIVYNPHSTAGAQVLLQQLAGRREGLWETRGGRLVLAPRGFLRIDTVEDTLARRLP